MGVSKALTVMVVTAVFSTGMLAAQQNLPELSAVAIPSATCEGKDVLRFFSHEGKGTLQLLRTFDAYDINSNKVVKVQPDVETIYRFERPGISADILIDDFDKDGDMDILLTYGPDLGDYSFGVPFHIPSYYPTFLSNDGGNNFSQVDLEDISDLEDIF